MNSSTYFLTPRFIERLACGCSIALLSALSACEKQHGSQTVGQQLDVAVAKTEQAAIEAKAKTETFMAKAGDSMKVEAEKAKTAGKTTADSVTVTVLDSVITASVLAELARDTELKATKINVNTQNGIVTLNGSSPTLAAREKASFIAKGIKGVVLVDNKLVVSG